MKQIQLPLTKQTGVIALALFSLYFVYGMFHIPVVQYLVSLAVGGLAYGISGRYEIATISLLVMHFVYPAFGGPTASQGYKATGEGFVDAGSLPAVLERVRSMRNPLVGVRGVGSATTEGFEDANAADMTVSETKSGSTENTKDVSATSKPAPTETEQSSTEKKATAPSTGATEASPPKTISEQGVPPANQPAAPETFQDNGSLFKLGAIPTDMKGGFHIDSGTTIMNALKSLKPDQIANMTADTKQLIETQKSLMQMLQTFSPMVKEGKEMMDTFQTMFGSQQK